MWQARMRPKEDLTGDRGLSCTTPEKYTCHRGVHAKGQRFSSDLRVPEKRMLAKAVAGEAECAVFLHFRFGIRRNVCRYWARPKCVTCSDRRMRKHRVSSSSTRSTRSGRNVNSARDMSGNDEREQTLNQLLTEMDGFDGSIRAWSSWRRRTARMSLIRRLLGPGRFDRRVPVELPDLAGREGDPQCSCEERSRMGDDV